MKQICGYLLVLFVVTILACQSSQNDEDANDNLPITPLDSTIASGFSTMTEEEHTTFNGAVDGILTMLNDKNECINFNLIQIRDATKHAAAENKYRVDLVLKPVLVDPKDPDCGSYCITEAIKDELVVQAVVVVQSGKIPKYRIEIQATPGVASKLGRDGEMILNCTPTLPPTLLPGWTQMTPDELFSPQFMMVLNNSIEKLNKYATVCFIYKLDRVMEGRSTAAPERKYLWLMNVHHIYDNTLPGCVGWCGDECSGMDIWKGNAKITAQNKTIIDIRFVQ